MDAGSVSPPAASFASVVRRRLRRLSPWELIVVCSFALLAFGGAAMGTMRLTSARASSAATSIDAQLTRVELEVERGNVTILGGGNPSPVVLRHHDRSTFGHEPTQVRTLEGGILRVSSRCPTVLLGSCSSDYRLIVPDNVSVLVRARHGDINLDAYHGSAQLETEGGSIRVDAFCGFVLQAITDRGSIDAAASCSPQRMELRSNVGDVTAVVPPARYEIEARSSAGHTQLRGVSNQPGAPWSISAISADGDVTVEAS